MEFIWRWARDGNLPDQSTKTIRGQEQEQGKLMPAFRQAARLADDPDRGLQRTASLRTRLRLASSPAARQGGFRALGDPSDGTLAATRAAECRRNPVPGRWRGAARERERSPQRRGRRRPEVAAWLANRTSSPAPRCPRGPQRRARALLHCPGSGPTLLDSADFGRTRASTCPTTTQPPRTTPDVPAHAGAPRRATG